MPRPPDIGWQYGTMIGGHRHHVKCNYCHRVMIGGITRFKKHLASKRGEIKGCDAVPEEVKELINNHLASVKPRRPNKRKRNSADGADLLPNSSANMESDATDPDGTNCRQELLAFNEQEINSLISAEQHFEVGARNFFDAFASAQSKDEQVCLLNSFFWFHFLVNHVLPLLFSKDFAAQKMADLGWAHGVMVNGDRQKIECKYCQKVILGGGISRLKQHLAGERGNIAPCDKVPEDVKVQMQHHLGYKVMEKLKKMKDIGHEHLVIKKDIEEYNGNALGTTSLVDCSQKSRGTNADELNSDKRTNIETSYIGQPSTAPQSMLQLSFVSEANIDEADIAVAKFFYDAGIPFNAANSLYFQRMADILTAVGPGYKMPSYHLLRNKLLSQCSDEAGLFTEELRKSWEVTGCTVMVDRSKDKAGRSIINFFVYCPKGTMFLKSVDVTEIETSSESLLHLLDDIVNDVGPKNIIHFLADGDPWYMSVGKELVEKYRTFFWNVSVNHFIEVTLTSLSKMDEVHSAMLKAKKISQFIYNNEWALTMLKKITEGRDIVQLARTEFVTDFLTLQNIVTLRESLEQLFTSDTCVQLGLSEMGMSIKDTVLDLQFWQLCAKIIKVSDPLITVLYLADSGESPSLAYIYDAIEKAKKDIILAFNEHESDYFPYLDIINQAQDVCHSPLHAVAYYLNPSIFYNCKYLIGNVIQKGLLDCIETLEHDALAQENIIKHKVCYEEAEGDFGRSMAIRGRETLPPATWWSMYASDYPDLQRFAFRMLSQTGSMTTLERNWNNMEYFHSSKNRLENRRLNDLAFVHYNLRLQQRQHVGDGGKSFTIEEFDPVSVGNDIAGDWINYNQILEGESITMVDASQPCTFVYANNGHGGGNEGVEVAKKE